MKGVELTREIEKELIRMVEEGYEASPITHTSLFKRLKAKKLISTKGTLTTRTDLIESYKSTQISEVKGTYGASLSTGRNQSREDLIRRNAQLTEELELAKRQVFDNTDALMKIVKTIKTQTNIKNIERVLSPYLIRELVEDKNDI